MGFHLMLLPGLIMGIAMFWLLVVNYMFFQVKIENDRFYCRTSPFNGQWYKYSDIIKCKEIKKVSNYKSDRSYYFYFEFTDNSRKTHKFQFAKEIHGPEVKILKERIEKANGLR